MIEQEENIGDQETTCDEYYYDLDEVEIRYRNIDLEESEDEDDIILQEDIIQQEQENFIWLNQCWEMMRTLCRMLI